MGPNFEIIFLGKKKYLQVLWTVHKTHHCFS